MTDETIHFDHTIKGPIWTSEELRMLQDHLDHVQAATLLGEDWDVWVRVKGKLVHLVVDAERRESDGTKP